jgi:histone H3/H4
MAKKTELKREPLVVASKIRAYLKSKKMLTSSELIGAVSDSVYCVLDGAVERAKANRRSTVKAQDV